MRQTHEIIVQKLIKKKISDGFISFFSRCVVVDEKDRTSASELICHPWLRS